MVEVLRCPNLFLLIGSSKLLVFDLATTKGARDNVPVDYPLPNKDVNGPPMKTKRKYRSLIEMLGYLQCTTCPDVSMAAHRCARFNNDPRVSHERSVKKIVRYNII